MGLPVASMSSQLPSSRPSTALLVPPRTSCTGFVVVVVVEVAEEEAAPEDPEPGVPDRTLPSPIDWVSPLTPLVTLPARSFQPAHDVARVLVTPLAVCPTTLVALLRVCPAHRSLHSRCCSRRQWPC